MKTKKNEARSEVLNVRKNIMNPLKALLRKSEKQVVATTR
jgi:hypothetical protein